MKDVLCMFYLVIWLSVAHFLYLLFNWVTPHPPIYHSPQSRMLAQLWIAEASNWMRLVVWASGCVSAALRCINTGMKFIYCEWNNILTLDNRCRVRILWLDTLHVCLRETDNDARLTLTCARTRSWCSVRREVRFNPNTRTNMYNTE